MKQIFLSLLILSAIIYPLLILTSCTEEEMNSGTEPVNEMTVTEEEPDSEIAELERLAEEARENLIESIKETSSRPDLVRGLGGNNVNLNATENAAGADENSEVLI
jgi:hypothetical protein